MTKKDKKKSVRKRLDALSDMFSSVKDKAKKEDLGKLIESKLDEITAFFDSLGIEKGDKKKKKDKEKKGKEKTGGPKLPKLEPSKDIVNELQNSQAATDEAGNN